ncbi:MAG: hypothetical protein OXG38_07690 [Chloroflexi bacterium]|nr:hypothetical protein [Chloroflexota bacterium]
MEARDGDADSRVEFDAALEIRGDRFDLTLAGVHPTPAADYDLILRRAGVADLVVALSAFTVDGDRYRMAPPSAAVLAWRVAWIAAGRPQTTVIVRRRVTATGGRLYKIRLATPPGTIDPEDIDGVVVAAEVDVTRIYEDSIIRLEPAVVARLQADMDDPPTISPVDDSAGGEPENAYGVLWVERSGSSDMRGTNEGAEGLGSPRPTFRERALLWMRVQRGDAERAYGHVQAACTALLDYTRETL